MTPPDQLTEELARIQAAHGQCVIELNALRRECDEAYSRLSTERNGLFSECAQLKAQLAELIAARKQARDGYAALVKRCVALRGERDRLQAALDLLLPRGQPSEPKELDELYTANELIAKERDAVRQQLAQSDEALWRLRQICEAPYKAKHGRPLSTARGWVWEMVQFIHHSIAP